LLIVSLSLGSQAMNRSRYNQRLQPTHQDNAIADDYSTL
jgi:hypothetical protein